MPKRKIEGNYESEKIMPYFKHINIMPFVFLVFILNVMTVADLYGEVFNYSLHFDADEIILTDKDNTYEVEFKGCVSMSIDGSPDLPWKVIHLVLPPKTRIEHIYTETQGFELEGDYELSSRPSYRLDFSNSVEQRQENRFHPEENVVLRREGYSNGVHVVTLLVCPFNYYPEEHKLYFSPEIDIEIQLTADNPDISVPLKMTQYSHNLVRRFLESHITNTEDLDRFYPSPAVMPMVTHLTERFNSFPPHIEDDPADILIIVTDSLLPEVSDFSQEYIWGSIPVIVTVSEITAYYWGSDIAESIREFIKDAHEFWGITSLVLVGDHPQLPTRIAYIYDPEGGWLDVPTDLYYAALDGDWNYNRNEYYGDSDSMDDVIPELFCGRIGLDTRRDLRVFLDKLHDYRFHPIPEYLNRWLFAASALSHDGSDMIGPLFKQNMLTGLPIEEFADVYKLYAHPVESRGDEELSKEAFIERLNMGYNVINHIDHGNRYVLGMGQKIGGGGISISDADELTNAPYFPGLFYSFSCDVNAIDADNVAKHWIANPDGGGLSFVGNTRTAWTGQLAMDSVFFRGVLNGNDHTLGEAFYWLISEMPFRQYFSYIPALTGYPMMRVWMDSPGAVTVITIPDSIDISDTIFTVFVTDTIEHPLEGALVVIYSSEGRIAGDSTNAFGLADFSVDLTDEDYLIYAVTGNGIIPYVDTIYISTTSEPNLEVSSFNEVESIGDGDDLIELGEQVSLLGWIHNNGGGECTDLQVIARSEDLIFVDSVVHFGYVDIDDSVKFDDSLIGFVPVDFEGRKTMNISFNMHSTEGDWVDTVKFMAFAPQPVHILTAFNDSVSGDNDGVPEPGEVGALQFSFTNFGKGDFRSYGARLTNFTPGIEIIADSIGVLNTDYLESTTLNFPLRISEEYTGGDVEFSIKILTVYDLEFIWYLTLTNPAMPETMWTVPGVDHINIFWHPSAGVSSYGYYIYRSEDSTGIFHRIVSAPLLYSTYYQDYPLPERSLFYYKITAVDSNMNESSPLGPIAGWTSYPFFNPWPIKVASSVSISGAPALTDIDGDGYLEVFLTTHSEKVYAFYYNGWELFDSTSTLVDPFVTASGLESWASPAIGDIDDDGNPELVVVSRGSDWKVFAWEMTGELVEGWPQEISFPTLNCPVVEDLDGDRDLEILVATEHRDLYVWHHNGEPFLPGSTPPGLFAHYSFDSAVGNTYSSPAVGDIDDDGEMEIVVCGNKNSSSRGTVYAWKITGDYVSGWPISIDGYGGSSPAIGNLDDDEDTKEIVLCAEGDFVYAFNYRGEVLDGFPVHAVDFPSAVTTSPALADFDYDGRCEIVVAGTNGLAIISPDGEILDGWPVYVSTDFWAAPCVADINSDGDYDILCAFDYEIMGYSQYGEPLSGFPLETGYTVLATPTIADLNNDSLFEVLIPSWDSHLYIWQLNGHITGGAPWFTDRGNFQRTGCYGRGTVDIEEPKIPVSFSVNVYPTPFNSKLNIKITNPERDEFSLKIFNLLGDVVYTRSNRMVHPEMYIVWDGKNMDDSKVSAGIYFVSVGFKNQDNRITRKVIFLK
ncbi:VCBS repeat-containing protein [bacterium]|nr:VCBS repeat-containing protein [bacterium]